MRFKEFWPLYLRAHRLPGTRALHYFATSVGLISAIEAVATEQPAIFVLGIAISYAIAILAHWFVEHNQPLIRVSAFWGAVADLRMCWLALRGQMGRELARHRVLQPAPPTEVSAPGLHAAFRRGAVKMEQFARFGGQPTRLALLIASTTGLTVGLMDLSDLGEPMEGFAFPLLQLGAPVAAFAGALVAALAVIGMAQGYVNTKGSSALALTSPSLAGTAHVGDDDVREIAPSVPSASEMSLRRACIVLLSFGTVAFALAELAEHGLPAPGHFYGMITGLAVILCIGVPVAWQLLSGGIAGRVEDSTMDSPIGGAGVWTAPRTRGLRVDSRVQLVDALENLLSFGRRRAILEATLIAADLQSGDRLVDVGCGTGELALAAAYLLASGDRNAQVKVTGIDATPGMIEIARGRAREFRSAARFDVAIAEALPFPDESMDAVTSTFFFHHLPTDVKRQAMREMWRVLAPGGRLIVTDYGWARSFGGLVASFPMRFNFHEYVRPQLNGELERIIASEGLGTPDNLGVFLDYIRVLRVTKPAGI